MSLASPLRLSLIPGVALGGLLGGVLITNIVTRLSQRERISSLFVRRRARKPCPRCAGFGITRCSLCGGEAMCVSETQKSLLCEIDSKKELLLDTRILILSQYIAVAIPIFFYSVIIMKIYFYFLVCCRARKGNNFYDKTSNEHWGDWLLLNVTRFVQVDSSNRFLAQCV